MLARYTHTNIVARDWRRLADFYEKAFGCTPVPPERRHRGPWVEACTGVPGAGVDGLHLRLPGCGADGPTLEIFQYHPPDGEAGDPPPIHRPGFAHIAFAVDDVAAARQEVLTAGGADYAEMVTTEVPGAGRITLIYMTDPEGNIIELQRWEPAERPGPPDQSTL